MNALNHGIRGQLWSLGLVGLIGVLLGGGSALYATESVRIVSQTVGTDEIVLAIAEPEQIAALSHLSRHVAYSAVAKEAAAYAQIELGDAETILKYEPTLVLGADYSRTELLDQIERAGVRVMRLSDYGSLAAAYRTLRLVAKAIGPHAEAKAEALIGESQVRVHRLEKQLEGVTLVNVIAPSTYGVIGGDQTTFQDMCDHSGAINLATTLGGLVGHQAPPVERMLTWPIDFVVLAGPSVDEALQPYAKLPPYPYLAVVQERRVALIEPYMLNSVSHYRIDGYEALARALHPEAFAMTKGEE